MRTILWIDDQLSSSDVEIRFLTLENFQVDCAPTAARGLQLARAGAYDAIVLELELPDGSGLSVLARLRAHGHSPPIVILTGSADFASAFAAGRLGASAFETKPIAVDELAALLTRVSGAARPSTDAVVRNDRAEPLGSVALADLLDVLHRVGAGQAVAEGLSGQCGAAAALEAAIVRALIDPALPLPVFLACARAFRTTHAAPDASVRVLTGEIEEWLFAAIAVAVPADPRVATALSVIERAIADRLRPTEQQIADAVHVDRAHLGRLIRDETGLSFRQWRTGLFLRFSVGHLLGTSERVGQIAWHVLGYEHVSQFDREFRELFGLSPREFRERAQQIGPSHRPVLVATMRRDDRNDVS